MSKGTTGTKCLVKTKQPKDALKGLGNFLKCFYFEGDFKFYHSDLIGF